MMKTTRNDAGYKMPDTGYRFDIHLASSQILVKICVILWLLKGAKQR